MPNNTGPAYIERNKPALPTPPPKSGNTNEFGTFSSPKGGSRKKRQHKKKTRKARR
jgi:hypothetical protein